MSSTNDGGKLTRHPPGRDDFDVRFQSVEGEFETDLVVAFACASVRYKAGEFLASKLGAKEICDHALASFLICYSNHATRNDRAGERGAQQINILQRDEPMPVYL
jgi:hypothetical protein